MFQAPLLFLDNVANRGCGDKSESYARYKANQDGITRTLAGCESFGKREWRVCYIENEFGEKIADTEVCTSGFPHENILRNPIQFHRTVGVQVLDGRGLSDGGSLYAQNDAWLLDGIMAVRKMNAEVPWWSFLHPIRALGGGGPACRGCAGPGRRRPSQFSGTDRTRYWPARSQ